MDVRRFLDQPLLDDSFPLPTRAPFTVAEARDEGLTHRQLKALIDSGHLRRPIRGVYLASQAGDSPRLRAACIRLVVPDGAVVCDRHAGWLHGAEMALAPNEHLELRPLSIFRLRGMGRLRNDLSASGERDLRPADVEEIEGILVTSAIRTAWDLGRQRLREDAIAGLDSMLRLGVFSKDELLDGVNRFAKQRWITRLRELAPLADPKAASPGESVLRLRWIDCGLPTPQLQVEVWADGVLIAVLDIANEDVRYAAEYDGAEWHSSPEQREHDRRRREAASRERWHIDAFTKSAVFGSHRTVDSDLHAGLVQARRAYGARVIL